MDGTQQVAKAEEKLKISSNRASSHQLQATISSCAEQGPLRMERNSSKRKLRNRFTSRKQAEQGHVAEKKGSYIPEQRLIRDRTD